MQKKKCLYQAKMVCLTWLISQHGQSGVYCPKPQLKPSKQTSVINLVEKQNQQTTLKWFKMEYQYTEDLNSKQSKNLRKVTLFT